MTADRSLTRGKMIAFSSPAFAFGAVGMPISMYIAPYYAADLGLGLAVVGSIMMLARFWDMFTDPLLGVISDKFPSRWGRRRHWMVLGTPVLMVAVVLMMFPKQVLSGPVTPLYFAATMFLLYAGFTMLEISHTSWGAELSEGYHERSLIQGWRQLAGLTGAVFVLGIPMLLELNGYALDNSFKVSAMGVYILCLLPITVFLAVRFMGEKPAEPVQPLHWKVAVRLVAKNPYFLRILLADLMIALPSGVRSALYVFYLAVVIKMPEVTAFIMLSYFVAGPIAVPLWIKISQRIGKHRACALGVLGHVIVSAMYLLPGEGDGLMFAVLFFASGIVYAGVPFLLRSITADVTDADKVDSGQDRAGLFYSLITMTSKVGGAVGIGASYLVLDWIGFDPASGDMETGVDGLRYIFAFTPLLTELLVFWVLYRFPLDEAKQQAIQAELLARQVTRK